MADKDKAPKALKLPANLLKADPQNARTIEAPALRGLGVSMETFGDLSGIVWNERSGHLVAGHQRMNRLKAAGVDDWVRDGNAGTITHPKTGEVFTIRIVDWDPTTERMANLTANNPQIQGDFTEEAAAQLRALEDEMMFEALALDGLQEDLDREIKKAEEEARDGLTDPDDVPEPPVKPITNPGDLWALGEHRLLCGDSTRIQDVSRLMGGQHADCVVTSPPYAVGIDYIGYEDTIANLRAMLAKLPDVWARIVRPGGFAVVNFVDIVSGREAAGTTDVCEYPMALEYWPAFRDAGWVLWTRRIWCKPNGRVTAPWCANSNRSACDWEHVWTWKAPGMPILGRVDSAQNGWFDSSHGEALEIGKDIHGAPMPTQVAARLIRIHTPESGLVHEPFGGTGTTLVAAERVSRRCYAMELAPAYCDVIVARWEAFTGKKAVRHPAPDPAAKPTKGVKAPSQPTP